MLHDNKIMLSFANETICNYYRWSEFYLTTTKTERLSKHSYSKF